MAAGWPVIARGGIVLSIVVGFVGAVVGVWIARKLRLPDYFSLQFGDKSFPIVWSIVGATLFSVVVGVITRRRSYLE